MTYFLVVGVVVGDVGDGHRDARTVSSRMEKLWG